MAITVSNPPSPNTPYTPISSEGSMSVLGNGAASPTSLAQAVAAAVGRQSSSFDVQRRRSRGSRSGSDSLNGHVISSVKTDHPYAHPLLASVHVESTQVAATDADADASATTRESPVSVTVAPTPKERLPPSPPLTPVASKESLRKVANASKKRALARVARDDVAYEEEDGDLSAGSYHSDGEHMVQSDNGDDSSPAGPSTSVAVPLPSQTQPLQDSESDADNASMVHPTFLRTATSSSMLAGQEEPSHSRSHPLDSAPDMQPWDLVDPPASSSAQQMMEITEVEGREKRRRNISFKSARNGSGDVVVKDGKRYRIPHSSYYFGPPPNTSAFGTEPIGHIGVHHPREVIRIERDYSGGELVQFSPAYPLELEGRITPTQFLETINAINESLIEAHSLRWSFLDNTLALLTLYISRLFIRPYYDREMRRLYNLVAGLNKRLYNPVGLNILWPKDVAFMFLEVEYY
ncbi:hypothetical protein M0805_000272 [Coniferiporia weirii]|nr:hypothetical protein M0805_000272 [Coniferiporia weirii]